MNREPKEISSFLELTERYDTFIFDCDGVLWDAGHKLEQAFFTLNLLKSKGKHIFFVTNNSTKSRKKYAQRISDLGFEATVDQIYPSSYVAPAYIKLVYPEVKRIYIIGMEGLVDEATEAGFEIFGGPEDNQKRLMTEHEFTQMPVKENVDAILVGFDMDYNYYKLAHASACIQKGAKFFATNDDPYDMAKGMKLPVAGAMISPIELTTGEKAMVLGKPNKYSIELIVEKYGIAREKCIMIGDRIDTDILIGKNSGVDTCLVFTGVANRELLSEELKKSNPITPDFICKAVCIE